jgi:hypothetical protein
VLLADNEPKDVLGAEKCAIFNNLMPDKISVFNSECCHEWAQEDAAACNGESSKYRMLSECLIITTHVQT